MVAQYNVVNWVKTNKFSSNLLAAFSFQPKRPTFGTYKKAHLALILALGPVN